MRNPADVSATDPDRGRYSARRKTKAILRLLRGEDIDVVSRELGVTAATVAGWHSLRSPGTDSPGLRTKSMNLPLSQDLGDCNPVVKLIAT